MSNLYMNNYKQINDYICGRYYVVKYYEANAHQKGCEHKLIGILLQYGCANYLVFLNEQGIWHIREYDIVSIKPLLVGEAIEECNDEYKNLVKSLQKKKNNKITIEGFDGREPIRCKNCKWWVKEECTNVISQFSKNSISNPDFFCQDAEQKDKNNSGE